VVVMNKPFTPLIKCLTVVKFFWSSVHDLAATKLMVLRQTPKLTLEA
jgi:hypothetical protein